ncbi:MAG TPA: DNA replication and repair protein RecF [Candidatus Saccharimonadia bacterium]|nr:DNA replication and repair protein RecF [Candidatus Saccharimonadia bacterium]
MITDLRLQDFRSYKDDSFELSPGVNIVVGPNASGKTNLLEAVLVLARGSSYRATDAELVKFGRPWARLDGHNEKNETRTVKLVIEEGQKPAKTYELQGKTYRRMGLAQSLPVVLFEPNHLQLFVGGPERRRDYLDDLLEQTTPGFSTLRRQYRRALAQRNSLLKQPDKLSETQVFPWNIRLSQLAGQLVRARSQLVEDINKNLGKLYKKLAGSRDNVTAIYESRWIPEHYESHFLKKLETSLEDDRLRGFTSSGPHREDLAVMFGGHPAQSSASRGEVRTVVLALKILELKLLENARDATPLLLLDDVFSELDGKRRHALTDYLAPYQTFITTTDADLVTKHFTDKTSIITVTKYR